MVIRRVLRVVLRGQRRAGRLRKQRGRFDSLLHRAFPRRRRAAGGRPSGAVQKRRPLLVLMEDLLRKYHLKLDVPYVNAN